MEPESTLECDREVLGIVSGAAAAAAAGSGGSPAAAAAAVGPDEERRRQEAEIERASQVSLSKGNAACSTTDWTALSRYSVRYSCPL